MNDLIRRKLGWPLPPKPSDEEEAEEEHPAEEPEPTTFNEEIRKARR